MVDDAPRSISNSPYNPGDIVHIRHSAPEDVPELYHHKHACEVVAAYRDYSTLEADSSATGSPDNYVYKLSPVTKDTTLSALYSHSDLLPSPRGYENIDELLGEQSDDEPPEWERTLGKFMRGDLEEMNECLTVVRCSDPTKDWMREIGKGDIDRINSAFAEMLLLYQFRAELGYESVQMNAQFGEKGKDVDIRAKTNDWDVWLEVYKPDYLNQIPEGGGWFSPQATGTLIGNKLRKKFDNSREQFPDDAIIVFAVYLVESNGQNYQLNQWLDQDYFDISNYCDALLTFSHYSFPTRFNYQPITPAGEDCWEFFDSIFSDSTE